MSLVIHKVVVACHAFTELASFMFSLGLGSTSHSDNCPTNMCLVVLKKGSLIIFCNTIEEEPASFVQ